MESRNRLTLKKNIFRIAIPPVVSTILFIVTILWIYPSIKHADIATPMMVILSIITTLSICSAFCTISLERKQENIREELNASNEQLKDILVSAARLSFIIVNTDGLITSFSKGAEKMLGYSSSETAGRTPLISLFTKSEIRGLEQELNWEFKSDFHGFQALVARAYRNGRDDRDFKLIKKDATNIYVTMILSTIHNKSGEVTGYLGALLDKTASRDDEEEKRFLQNQLRQSQKLEAIGALAGGISHDFNNILFSALGFAEIARAESPEGSRTTTCLDQILIALKRASNLVKQILEFSRRKDIGRTPIKLQLVVKEALELLRNTIPSNVEIIEEIDINCPVILADATQMHQIVINLCTNSYQAMNEQGGAISVELKSLNVDDNLALSNIDLLKGYYVHLMISDNGRGMDRETMKRIFDPYFTTKKVGEGTGLGLSTVHGIVKHHRGAISVESEIGNGTSFGIYFPISHDQEIIEYVPVEDNSAEEMHENILFVDDEAQIVKLGKIALERCGYKVHEFLKSEEAYEFFLNNPYGIDVVITDQTMPGMTGGRLAERMLEERPDIPIILCTGYSKTLTEEKAIKMGIKKYISKPIMINDLVNAIKEVKSG